MAGTRGELDQTKIIGISCETNGDDAPRAIGELWARAAASGVLGQGAEAFAVYDHYDVSTVPYTVTVTVGRMAHADELARASAGEAVVEVPRQRCLHIVTDGSIDGVQKAWADVWAAWPTDAGGPRAYLADLERWTLGPSGTPTRTDIYIGIRD